MKYLSILAIVVSITFQTFAQNVKVKGKVTDNQSKQPVSGASVVIQNKETKTNQNASLKFQLLLANIQSLLHQTRFQHTRPM